MIKTLAFIAVVGWVIALTLPSIIKVSKHLVSNFKKGCRKDHDEKSDS